MKTTSPIKIVLLIIISILGLLISLPFPDLDIPILGIGAHRFFLFHSAIIPLILFFISKLKLTNTVELIIISFISSFSLGIGIHLFIDSFQTKAVIFPFIGSLVDGTSVDDRIWLLANASICLLITIFLYKKAAGLLGLVKSIKGPVSAYMKTDKAIEQDLNRIKKRFKPEFEIYKDNKGEYRFRLKAANGEIIARSEGYKSKSACINGIKAVKKYSLTAEIEEIE